MRRAFPTEPDFDRKLWILQTSLESRRDGIFVEKRDLANLSPVGAASTETCQKCRGKSLSGIPNLAVLPQFQRHGIGRQLIEKALAYLQSEGMLYACIETLEQNPVGASFYPTMGFTEIAKQIHYIQPLSKPKAQ